jgi:hypothetical protein
MRSCLPLPVFKFSSFLSRSLPLNAQLLFALGVILLGMKDAADANKKSIQSLTTFGILLFVAALIAFALEHWPTTAS